MSLYWLLPRDRVPAPVFIVVDDWLHWLGTTMSKPVRNTPLEHWLLDREGRTTTLVAVTMVIALVGIVALHFSSRRRPTSTNPAVHLPARGEHIITDEDLQALITAQQEADEDVSAPSASAAQLQIEEPSSPATVTFSPLANQSAPTNLRPLNDGSSARRVRFADQSGHKTPTSSFNLAPTQLPRTPLPSDAQSVLLAKLQELKSSSRPIATPVTSSSRGDIPATPIRGEAPVTPSSDDDYRTWLMGTNHSNIKEKWPTSFRTSVESGDLLEDGTPTKKFVDRMVLKKSRGISASPAT